MPGFDYPGDYTSFQFVFVLLQAAAFGGVFTGFGIARDFEGGFGKRLLLASPNRLGILVGFGLAALVRWVITGGLLTIVALVIGMDVGGSGVDIVGLYTLALLVNVCGLLWSAGIALRFRSIQAGPLMQMPVFLVLFFAPVYVPLDLLSGWIETVADRQPDHLRPRGGPQPARGRPDGGRARVRRRLRADRGARRLGRPRAPPGRGGRLRVVRTPG